MRLFVAVELPAAVKDELDHAVDALRPSLPGARGGPRGRGPPGLGPAGRAPDDGPAADDGPATR